MKKEKLIQIRQTDEIVNLLDSFTPDLESLKSGCVDKQSMAEKFKRNGTVLALKESDEWLGFVAFYENDRVSNTAFLSMIAVNKRYRRRGWGEYLLECVINHARVAGMNNLKLEVAKKNNDAKAFYRNLGFKKCGEETAQSIFMVREI